MHDLILRRLSATESSLLELYAERQFIELDPVYQRIGGVWTREKKQLFIDSLINGFDVPKLYFQEFLPIMEKGEHRYKYAIIDGKQRLQTLWEFIDGKFPLAPDFKYFRDDTVEAGGLTYAQFSTRYLHIKSRFDATYLDVVIIRTGDPELIEELYSRLNEAAPLNAPEKRGAMGGPLPPRIIEVSQHRFFTECIPFPDHRYRHRDMATKFLYIEHNEDVVNTKKSDLDKFVSEFKVMQAKSRSESDRRASMIVGRVQQSLDIAAAVFKRKDPMLRQVAMVTVYYHLLRNIRTGVLNFNSDDDLRSMLAEFESHRQSNRRIIEKKGETTDDVDADLIEFEKHSQTPNDAYAIRIRLEILLRFLEREFGVTYAS